ncbi:speckle targeted PIP5K1A-regulated poly(A) polymerase [Trichonephila clavata]|uniref:Speckle targeted PIP5K1A-regulated poly(A) polymerase n=1 Tax=Trichonephila clavata TaxID=2740835 RepID=A0A8X6GMT9_TRICU|nr:speckle targeted PIP5K1A-regulated poly(A) polymerase [Trichonephila clavata]
MYLTKKCPTKTLIMKNVVIIFPKLLKAIIRNFSRKYVRKISNTENAISHTFLMQRLQSCRSIKEQLVTFDSYTKLTEADISLRRSVHQSVEESLKNHFPNCSVYLTGSTVSGLGLKGCDVDLSFQFLSNEDNQCDFSKGFQESFNSEYLKLSLKEKMKFLQNILNESKITGASKTISGRCPIVRFSCQNITCDLSIDNKLALHSTSFMLLCNMLDKRVAPLHRFLTYWAKSHKLIGGPFKFKTYAIFLLLLYFLQTRNPPVLPSVECMFEKTDFNNNFNNWSYDICKHLEKFEGSKNSQCIDELLREFFAFYAKFNFSNVICPLTNEIKMPSEFLSKETVDCKFPMNTISIQDPLDPDWNATSQVCLKFCFYFLKYLRLSYKTFNNDEIWLPIDDRWGVCYLFNDLSALQSSKRKINSKRIQNG